MLVRTVRELSQQQANEYPFQLTQVIFRPWEFQICNDTSVDDVRSFVQCVLSLGIELVELAVKLEDADPQALGQLLLSTTPRLPTDRRTSKTEALMVTKNSLAAFAGVCSALVTSTTYKRLQLYEAFDDPEPQGILGKLHRTERWKWLGFALFSHASRSSIRELYVDEDRLLLSDIEALKRTADASEPVQVLVSSDDTDPSSSIRSSTRARAVKLSPDAKLRLTSTDNNDCSLTNLLISETDWFSIITEDTDSEWMEILVPGYGRAFVACDSVIASTDVKADAAPPLLTCLHLAFNQCEQGVLAMLMRTIGQSLVSLDIDAKDVQLVRASDVAAIVQSCPHLKLLSTNRANLGSLGIFTEAYENTRCRISTLSLCNVEVTNASLRAFAGVLKDHAHPMTKMLREFRYIYGDVDGPSEIPRPDSDGVKAFLEMLRSNRTLSFFELGLDKRLHQKYAPKFRDLDAKLLVSHASDLPLASKLAFLSCIRVVESKSKKRRRQSRGEADQRELSQAIVVDVFQFARKRILRVVSVTT